MTIGNTGGTQLVAVTPRYRDIQTRLTPPLTVTVGAWTNYSPNSIRTVNTKVWSGTDRAKYVETAAEKQTRRRTYTVPTYRRRRSASGYAYEQVGVAVRHFYTRPIPKRVRSDVQNKPNAYTVVWNYIVDGTMNQTSGYTSGGIRHDLQYEKVTCNFRSAIPNMSNVAFTANEDLQLINKLKSRIRGSSFDLSVFLGEGHETLRMLSSQMLRIAEAGWYARKGHIKAALKVLGAGKVGYSPTVSKSSLKANLNASRDPLARNWLELQYGLLPLLSDVKEGAEQLSHILHYPKTKRYTAKLQVAIPLVLGQHRWKESQYLKTKRITAYVTEPENLATISGILDPEIVAWELVPFSFIADWVTPIGDWLSARAFVSKLNASYVITSTTTGYVTGYLGDSTNTTVGSNNYGRNYCNSTRVISTTLAVPRPTVKKLDEIASWKHLANATALVQTIFGGSRNVKKSEIDRLSQSNREALYGSRQTRSEFRSDAKTFV